MRDFLSHLFIRKTDSGWVQFLRYFLSGGSAFVVYFVLLFVFTEYGHIYHLTSLVIAYGISIFVNFFISKYFVFSSHQQKSSQQFVKFFSVALIGFCLQYCLVLLFTQVIILQYLIANVIASALVYIVSFTLNRLFTFRK